MASTNADSSSSKTVNQVVVTSRDGKVTEFNRPMGGDLTLSTEGGRTIIEKKGMFGRTTTYIPSTEDSIEAVE